MRRALPATLLLVILSVLPASAAEKEVAQFNTRIWQSDQGLPLDAAQSVAQTPDGYLWVGTKGGLARFDGTHFDLSYGQYMPELTNANVIGLRVTRDGSLWMATRGKGVQRLKDGQFQRYGKAEGLAGEDCLGPIFEDAQGTVWISTLEGLSQFHNGIFTTTRRKLARAIAQDHSDNVWFATATGLDLWSNGGFALHLAGSNGLHNTDVRSVCCRADGSIWAASGVEIYRVAGNRLESVMKWNEPTYNLITVLYEDKRGEFWVGSYDGLNRIVNGKFVPVLNVDGLPFGTVLEIFEDREDNLWVCAKDGLIRLKPNRVLCYTERQGLANDNVSSVMEERSGAICIGTWGGGINRLQNGVITPYTNANAYPLLVLGLHEDAGGHLWAGTDYNEGLYELDDDHVNHITKQNGADIPAVRVIFEDRAGVTWVGTSGGLFKMRDGNLELETAKDGPGRDVIRAICDDHEGNLWLGTHNGLYRRRNGIFTRFTTTNIPGNDIVLAVFEDKKNQLWLGMPSRGLIRFNDGALTNYTSRDGLYSDNVYSIIEDDRGWLWMGSDRGIFRVNKKNLDDYDRHNIGVVRSIAYGKTDGMVNRICNNVASPSVWKSLDGRLWFATIKGLCVVDPKREILPEAPPPPVVIEQVIADQQTVSDPQEPSKPIKVEPGNGELEFRYAALGFRAPEENRYKYKLDGVDSAWVEAEHRQIAHYNNIYPGHYRFRIVACNSDGVWNNAGATVALVLQPHFWQTWWFRPAILAVAAASLAVASKIVLHRRRELNQLRTRLAADLHDEIGSNLASIALLSQLGQKAGERHGSSELAEINRVALATVNSIREIVWFINPDYDTMPQLIARMRQAAAQMLAGVSYSFDSPERAANRKLSLQFRRNLFLILKELLHNAARHSGARKVEIVVRVTHGAVVLCVADDGRGFNPAAVNGGTGLRNIRARADQLRGDMQIGRRNSGGTVVTVSVQIT